ncbi:PREDICTED: mitochondrial cardiolipin hydrolase-like [Nicrophorus vespilloides]|uniref:Mitochondrial cardiolipin hydrolase n=1 Tax=Nicrophorus vespilloides TaxID=110193 RepID=A0ABM1N0C7_NICVS|nr:PREDICTED: mitochondrial cardiolipin hydrolase-like [Nicrophorus vespilloides]
MFNWKYVWVLCPFAAGYLCYRMCRNNKLQFEKTALDHRKHNCVVMYSRERGMCGWPEYPEGLKTSISTYYLFNEPLLFFVKTAKKTVDIAIMHMSLRALLDSLVDALDRGVAVRIIFDYTSMRTVDLKFLEAAGAEIIYYVNDESENIFHYKYAVKDYSDKTKTGYAMCGSMNWSQTGIIENYEDIVLTTAKSVVQSLHDNFEESWTFLKKENCRNVYVKTVLDDFL